MPNIEEVNAGPGALQVPERGSEAYAQMGRRVGSFYHQIGEDVGGTVKTLGDQYVEHQTNQEVNHLYAATTTAEQNLEQAWQTYSTDPANKGRTDLASSFMSDHVKPVLDELASHAQTDTGKRLAAEEVARVSQNIFHRTTADQSDLEGATWHNNALQTMSNVAAGALSDPSTTDQRIGDWMRIAENTIPSTVSAGRRAELLTQFQNEGAQRIALAGYLGGIEAAKNQFASGATTSPALDAARRDIAAQRNFQYLSPAQQAELSQRADEAQSRGETEFRANQSMQRTALETQGKGTYASLDARVQAQLRPGATADPSLTQDISTFTTQYGSVLPGESSALQTGLTHMASPEEQRKLVPDNTPVAATMISALGTPNAPTEAQISQAEYSHQINPETAAVLRSGNALSQDPTTKAAMASFKEWQGHMISGLPMGSSRGAAAAIFQHDSMQRFQQWIASGETPAQALEIMSNPSNPRNFIQAFGAYKRAANQTDPAAYIRRAYTGSAAYASPVAGSAANPVWPTQQGAPAPGPGGASAVFNDGSANARTVHLQPAAPAATPERRSQVHSWMSGDQ